MGKVKNIIIIGGGAASFFFAANAAVLYPNIRFTILEKGKKVLSKVLVSGGGRCNVTHACFDPQHLIEYYPRGGKELLGAFYHFGPSQMVEWLDGHNVKLKTEADGRMFPITDKSSTIANCLKENAIKNSVKVITGCKVVDIQQSKKQATRFIIKTLRHETFKADKIFIGTGSNPAIWKILESLGHTIIKPVPSLFTFKTKDTRLRGLAGISVPNVNIKLLGTKLITEGPLLVTHWGLSAPAILKLSAWGARHLNEKEYRFQIEIDWLPHISDKEINDWKNNHAKKQLSNYQITKLPKRLWQNFLLHLGVEPTRKWADLNKEAFQKIILLLKKSTWSINGKTTFKEEFVTAGGVDLKEVDFKTFQSKLVSDLYFAGEVLNIDALTGGFNFQAAWTGAFIASEGLLK